MTTTATSTYDDILRDHNAAVQTIAADLRELIHDTVPAMTERAWPGWHGVGFRHPKAGYVCGIFPMEDSVRFLFEHGNQLADPDGVFTGGARQTRHIDLTDSADIPVNSVRALLLQAVAL